MRMPELQMVTKMIQVASSSSSKGCGLDFRKPDTASPYAADTCCDAYTCIQQYQTVPVLSGLYCHTVSKSSLYCFSFCHYTNANVTATSLMMLATITSDVVASA